MDKTENIATIRQEYSRESLDLDKIKTHPIEQFKLWFEEALQAQVQEPTAMHLCTVSPESKPSARIVLLKGIEVAGFINEMDSQALNSV